MSQYTTGEIARLCGVSVRTVQYYDTRGILTPSELSEGGRRLYAESDVRRLRLICFLRGLGLPINAIGELLNEENPSRVIDLLLDEQAALLRREIDERRAQLDALESLRAEAAKAEPLTVESLHDIAYIMETKKNLKRMHRVMIAVGIVMDIIEIGTLILWIAAGVWWPFAVGMAAVIAMGIAVCRYYYRRTVFLCPECHRVFRPSMREVLWAHHTPRTRKLTCTHCGYKGFCVETYGSPEDDHPQA